MAFLSFGPYFQLKESIKEVQAKSIALDEDYKKLVNKVNELEKTMIKYESQPRIGSEQSPGPNKKVK